MAQLRLPSSGPTTVTRGEDRSNRIQSDSEPSEVISSQSNQLSLERTINQAWENSGDLPWMMNTNREDEVRDTEMGEFVQTGEAIGLFF